MSDDLVNQLRDRAYGSKVPDPLCEQAADEIERLRRELAARPSLTIKPGHQHASAAYQAGQEDEYSERMRRRYGGEW